MSKKNFDNDDNGCLVYYMVLHTFFYRRQIYQRKTGCGGKFIEADIPKNVQQS